MDEIVIIGGPNGAGKTTAAQLLVPQGLKIHEGRTVTDKTPREIVDAIDKALKETAARLAAKPKLRPPRSNRLAGHGRPNTPREILDAIDRSLKETHRRIAERDY